MPTVPQLIQALESRKLLPPAETTRLRQLYDAAPSEFGVRVMLKWLVNRGRLTQDQALKIQQAGGGASVYKILDEVLGPAEELELAPDEPATVDLEPQEDDTKDLIPAEDVESQQLALPPRGNPKFNTPPSKQVGRPPAREPEPLLTPDAKVAPTPQLGAYTNMLDDLFAGDASASPLGGALPAAKPLRPKLRTGWDSPLMLVGGAVLLLLVLGGTFLVWRIMRASGDEAFRTAETAYNEGAYSRAIELYDQFLLKYPRHLSANQAVVHRGLSRIRLAVEGSKDWSSTRRATAEVLNEIATNEEFGGAHADLGVLLPDIAQNLAREALAKNSTALLEEAVEAQALVTKYLPASEVLTAKNAATETLFAQARFRFDRGRRAAETAAAMQAAVDKREIAAAFAAFEAFAASDPLGAELPVLREALRNVAAAGVEAVRFVERPVTSVTEDPDAKSLYFPLVVSAGSDTADDLRGTITFAVAGGTAFAFDSADGRLLWRRTVGFDEIIPPRQLAPGADADALLHDSVRNEFLVVAGATGALKRRIPIPAVEQPGLKSWANIVGSRLLLTQASGKLYSIDLSTGAAAGYVEFPQALQQAATLDTRAGVIYQPAGDGVVYVLGADDLRPLESVSLGSTGQWTTSPVRIGSHLLVFERRGDAGRMIVCETERDGRKPRPVGAFETRHYVGVPPVVVQRYAAVLDLGGDLRVFDFSAGKIEGDVTPIAQYTLRGGKMLRPLAAQGVQLWVAGTQLECLELQPTLGKLTQIKAYLQGSPGEQPPTLGGESLVHVYRDDKRKGAFIAALAKTDGRELWRRQVGIPIAVPPTAVGARWLAAAHDDVDLQLFTVDRAEAAHFGVMKQLPKYATTSNVRRLLGEFQVVSPELSMTVAELRLSTPPPPRRAQEPDPNELDLFGYELIPSDNDVLKRRQLARGKTGPAAQFRVFQGGAVIPMVYRGVAFRFIANKMPSAVLPFLPPQVGGTRMKWSRPEIADDSVVISDGLGTLYRLELDELQQRPALVQRAKTSLNSPSVGHLAVAGQFTYLIDAENVLRAFRLPELVAGLTWPLDGQPAWNGPVARGSYVFAAYSIQDGIDCLALDGAAKLLWRTQLPDDAYAPAVDGDDVFIACGRGKILRLAAADGRQAASIETGLALTQPPIVDGDRLILTTVSGELVWIARP
jgi:outer membrane protein assembly factor BamB/tetratricopeptide (TPR) repeat protein